MLPILKNYAAAGYQGPVKIELLKGAGLMIRQVLLAWKGLRRLQHRIISQRV